jgi:hypothetical protein
LKKTFVIILTLIGIVTFGQENKLDRIENEVNLINSDSTLIESKFEVTNDSSIYIVIAIWHIKNKIYKIEKNSTLNYGEIKSTLYLSDGVPIKIIETESENYFLPDSLVQIKGYDVDIMENYKGISYIYNWKKNKRELIQTGQPTGNSDISIEWSKYIEILRKSIKLISE